MSLEQLSSITAIKQLAILRTDVPLAEELDDLRWRGAYREDLSVLCEELADESLIERIHEWRSD